MTQETAQQNEQITQHQLQGNAAVAEFVHEFEGCLGSTEFDRGQYSPTYLEDVQAIVTEDVPLAIEQGDLNQAQSLLEGGGGWQGALQGLNSARRDALAELHTQEMGEITPERRQEAWQVAQEAVRGATWHDNDGERARAFNALFGGNATAAELDEAITFLEDIINEESVLSADIHALDPNPRTDKIDALRTARDISHDQYKFKKEVEDNQIEFTGRIRSLVGDNEEFPRENIAQVSGWLTGASAENMRTVLDEAEGASDPQERMSLLLDLVHGRIPISSADSEAFAKWQERRQADSENRAAKRKAMDEAKARTAVESAFQGERHEDSTSIELKVAKLGDPNENPALAEAISRFTWQELSNKPNPSPAQIRSVMVALKDRTTLALMDEEGRIRAVGGLADVDRDAETATIVEVATASDRRGDGLGKKIMTLLEDEARKEGAKTVKVDSLRESEGFYQKLGYNEVNGVGFNYEKKL